MKRIRNKKPCVDCGDPTTKTRCKPCGYKSRVIPVWNKGLTGIHLSPKSEFRKGHIPWNKGLPEYMHNHWKGDLVGYDGIHSWVEKHLGKPRVCEMCKTTLSRVYQWSNKSGDYRRDLSDWQRLCVKCHTRYDYEKFGARKAFYEK